jgi:hypothetical protein
MGFRQPDAAIVVRRDLMALLTRFHPVPPPEEYYFTEVEMLSAFEVRVLGAALISRTRDSGAFEIYPTSVEYRTADANFDLASTDLLQALTSKLKRRLVETSDYDHLLIHHPPCMGGRSYRFNRHATLNRDRFCNLVSAIDVNNHLLIRGLGALIKAGMLYCHTEFTEHACIALWIALDASFQLFRREMETKGYHNPSAIDVGNYLDELQGFEPSGERYFADFYNERVKTIHPQSKFGAYPAAPLAADEYRLLRDGLVPTYEYLITGRLPPLIDQ